MISRAAWFSLAALAFAAPLCAEERIPIQAGDRIVLLGDAFVERLQTQGFFETVLMSRISPEKKIQIRNLGWSGDTVQGIARAVFGSPEDGYKRLLKDTREAKPTLIVLNYGGNEAHGGVAGLEPFTRKLNRLLDDLQSTGARLALVSPTPYGRANKLQPDPADYNRKLEAYINVLRETAAHRKAPFVDLTEGFDLTWKENGVHLSPYGYWRMADRLASAFGAEGKSWSVVVDVAKQKIHGEGVSVEKPAFAKQRVTFRAVDDQLPPPAPPRFAPKSAKADAGRITVRGLTDGQYQLAVGSGEKRTVLATADAAAWAQGVALTKRGGSDQSEQLRQAIHTKNELFFHRYRPQNETYLFLFRKHEQGNNAVEIPQFDPLVKEYEATIDRLRKRRAYDYALTRVGD